MESVDVKVRYEGGGSFYDVPFKSESSSEPITLACEFHKCLFSYNV